jgi:hypothetical protein
MDSPATISPAEAFAAAHAWWREAGVDCAFADEPVSWLKPPTQEPEASVAEEPRQPPAAPPRPPALVQDHASLPQRLEDFAPWWLGEPSIDTGGLAPRVPPRGVAGAGLMVIVPQPEPADSDSLLSGLQGEFLGSILSAMAIAPDQAYIAAALPRHMPMPDWRALHAAGLGSILRHHIALVAPGRVLLFGQTILPLLDHDPAQMPATFLLDRLGGGAVPIFASRDLPTLSGSLREKANFWRRWLEWTDPAAS